jgi:hypothetical protein
MLDLIIQDFMKNEKFWALSRLHVKVPAASRFIDTKAAHRYFPAGRFRA